MKKIIITEPIHQAGLKLLQDRVQVLGPSSYTTSELINLIPEVSGLLVRAFPLPDELYHLGDRLKIISKHGVGVDNINLPLATKNGIIVTNTPGANSNTVAEYTIALMMNISRKVCSAANLMYSTINGQGKPDLVGYDLAGKTLGIFGLGNIGSRIAKKCSRGLEMSVIGFDPFISKEQARDMGVKLLTDKKEVLEQSDYITLNLPLNKHTHHYITLEDLRFMKKTAYLINTSRGGIINENDLAQALGEGIIAGAAIDVLASEPPEPGNPLLKAPNILLTPHIAAQSEEAMIAMAEKAAQNLLAALAGEKPENTLNPEVFK